MIGRVIWMNYWELVEISAWLEKLLDVNCSSERSNYGDGCFERQDVEVSL